MRVERAGRPARPRTFAGQRAARPGGTGAVRSFRPALTGAAAHGCRAGSRVSGQALLSPCRSRSSRGRWSASASAKRGGAHPARDLCGLACRAAASRRRWLPRRSRRPQVVRVSSSGPRAGGGERIARGQDFAIPNSARSSGSVYSTTRGCRTVAEVNPLSRRAGQRPGRNRHGTAPPVVQGNFLSDGFVPARAASCDQAENRSCGPTVSTAWSLRFSA